MNADDDGGCAEAATEEVSPTLALTPALSVGFQDNESLLSHSSMKTKITLSPRLYFSYNQFIVYDQSVRLPGCAWTDEHSAQGFARRESTVNFNTPLEFGYAEITVNFSTYQPREDYERVIAVPFLVISGNIIVEGPEETRSERNATLPVGNYRLVAAQRITGDEEEAIDLFFEPLAKALERSSVLVADNALSPPTHLLETSGVAGEESNL